MSIKYFIFLVITIALKGMEKESEYNYEEVNSLLQAIRLGTVQFHKTEGQQNIGYPHYESSFSYFKDFNTARNTLIDIGTMGAIAQANLNVLNKSLQAIRIDTEKTFEQKQEDIKGLFRTLPERQKLAIHLHYFNNFINKKDNKDLKKLLSQGNFKKFQEHYPKYLQNNKTEKVNTLPAILKHMQDTTIEQLPKQQQHTIPFTDYQHIPFPQDSNDIQRQISFAEAYLRGTFIKSTKPEIFLLFEHFENPSIVYTLTQKEFDDLFACLRQNSKTFYKKPLYISTESKSVKPLNSNYIELIPGDLFEGLSPSKSFLHVGYPLKYKYRVQLNRICPRLNLDTARNVMNIEEQKQWLDLQVASEEADIEKMEKCYRTIRSLPLPLNYYLNNHTYPAGDEDNDNEDNQDEC